MFRLKVSVLIVLLFSVPTTAAVAAGGQELPVGTSGVANDHPCCRML